MSKSPSGELSPKPEVADPKQSVGVNAALRSALSNKKQRISENSKSPKKGGKMMNAFAAMIQQKVSEKMAEDPPEPHPEQMRRDKFKHFEPMQRVTKLSEMKDIFDKKNVRMFVDLKTIEFSFVKEKKNAGNINKIMYLSQLENLVELIDQWFGKNSILDESLVNISEQRQKYDFAEWIIKSDAYVFLPRYQRYNLVRFVTIMLIQLGCAVTPTFVKFGQDQPPMDPRFETPDKDVRDNIRLIKQLIEDEDIDIQEREEFIMQRKVIEEEVKVQKEKEKARFHFQNLEDKSYQEFKQDPTAFLSNNTIKERTEQSESEKVDQPQSPQEAQESAANDIEISQPSIDSQAEKQKLLAKRAERERKLFQELKEQSHQMHKQQQIKDPKRYQQDLLHKRIDYFIIKVKYYQLLRELDRSRKFLYKIELMVKKKLNNDHKLKTDYVILMAKNFGMLKDLCTAHQILMSWLTHLEDLDQNVAAVQIFQTKYCLLTICNRMWAQEQSQELLEDVLTYIRHNQNKYVKCEDEIAPQKIEEQKNEDKSSKGSEKGSVLGTIESSKQVTSILKAKGYQVNFRYGQCDVQKALKIIEDEKVKAKKTKQKQLQVKLGTAPADVLSPKKIMSPVSSKFTNDADVISPTPSKSNSPLKLKKLSKTNSPADKTGLLGLLAGSKNRNSVAIPTTPDNNWNNILKHARPLNHHAHKLYSGLQLQKQTDIYDMVSLKFMTKSFYRKLICELLRTLNIQKRTADCLEILEVMDYESIGISSALYENVKAPEIDPVLLKSTKPQDLKKVKIQMQAIKQFKSKENQDRIGKINLKIKEAKLREILFLDEKDLRLKSMEKQAEAFNPLRVIEQKDFDEAELDH